jgi:SAM-dependent methyltransferase
MNNDHLNRHLDLGCGGKPRNPYARRDLFGVDIAAPVNQAGIEIRTANLSVGSIPFPDNHFASVSAYDFLEHIPRVLPKVNEAGTRFPFIELMNEIWRVLAPGGVLYAMTPAYPHPAAFQDPTHVNILTDQSHIYFTQPELLGRMYGFFGTFRVVRILRVRPEFEYEPMNPGWRHRRRLERRARRGDASHLVWEFLAEKTPVGT